ncbi:MAG: MFS transporter [Aquabacterium sp.]
MPTLYFGQGIPFVVAMTLSVVLYKNLGVGNAEIALYTSWLYLPWVIKPLWSPLVELHGTKRRWIVALQFFIGAALAAVSLTLPLDRVLQLSLALFWLVAFASATHDIAADGFYMLALPQRAQAAFVGVRSTCWRLASIAGQGGLVVLAGELNDRLGSPAAGWAVVMAALGGAFMLLAAWHGWALPRPAADLPAPRVAALWRGFVDVFADFLRRPGIARVLAFLLLYRFAEAQLVKLLPPFLLDPVEVGGLGLRTQDLGLAYGTVGVALLTAGGLLGGWVISRIGLQRALWPAAMCLNLPNLVYVALALLPPQPLWVVSAAIGIEQFGYGLGFTAYLVFMLMVAAGPGGANPHRTAHYALCTGFMALGMMIPGLWAGWLQQQLGYPGFFAWVCGVTALSFAACALVRIEPGFGTRDA